VTLVGVVNADTGLFMPDFRAPERTVQLLLQVAGRAGRRAETTHSRAIVQTFNPDHYAIEAASRYDYSGFYKGEIRFRAEHGYPPYGSLARLVFTHPSHDRCERQSEALARYLRQMIEERGLRDVEVLGPAPCFVHKVRGKYRWQLLLRGENLDPLVRDLLPPDGWTLDVDPMSLL
jgi:primosomal protein N' (replication factor Y) (superfamily II helicase)